MSEATGRSCVEGLPLASLLVIMAILTTSLSHRRYQRRRYARAVAERLERYV